MFCGLGEEERTKFRKKKKEIIGKKEEKKEKKRNQPYRGQKWVGWYERES